MAPSPLTDRSGLSIRRRWLIGLLCVICGGFTVSARSQTASPPAVHVTNPPPVVSFDIFEPGPDGKIPEHATNPPISTTEDADGVPETHVGEVIARHIATISAAASGIGNPDLDIAGALRQRKTVSNSEKAALDWLARNYVELPGDAIVWHYTYTHTLNNIVVRPGWPSAFAQADVIKALLLAYARTSDNRYLDLAKRAGYAYSVPCEEGGLRCVVGGVPWYEEVPVPYGYASMILNGHLYSTVMLGKLLDIAHDDRIAAAFRVGVDSAKRMLLRYDTGYWSIYQQRPRLLNVILALRPGAPNTEIHSVSVSSPVSRPSVLQLGQDAQSTYPGNGIWGPGWGEINSWGRELIGSASVTILPGRLSIDHDPFHAGELTISVEYKSPGCIPPIAATYDYRARSNGMAMIPPGAAGSSEDSGCPMQTYRLPPALNQWSQITEFYHDWHTRLVTELWRITKEPKFYATAVRWGRYATAASRLDPEASKTELAVPIFNPTESPDDDAAIAAALGGKDPAALSDDEVDIALRRWIEAKHLPRQHALALLTRAGIAADTVKPPPGPQEPRTPVGDENDLNLQLSGSPQAVANAARPVSLVAVDKNVLVTSNYNHLSLIDIANRKVTDLAVDWRINAGKFVPTGLAFDEASRTLFIANYLGNNILVADLDLAQNKVTIRSEFGDGITVSPEGIAYDAEKKIVASAQYDGDTVAVFQAVGTGWQLRCTTAVPKAHGVAIGGRYIFATSLGRRQLLKIDPETCGVVGRMGELGWDAAAGQFMWPTTVQRLSNDMIGVSDAHTGHISIVDPNTLAVHSWFGYNGPGVGSFNMPYGFGEDAGRLIVTSTHGNRLIEFGMAGELLHSYSLGSTWPASYHPDKSRMLGPPNWHAYVGNETNIDMLGGCLHGGYGELYSCDRQRVFVLPQPGDVLLSSASYFYFTQVAPVPDGAIVTSPQNALALYMASTSSGMALLPAHIGFDSWLDGDTIVRSEGNIAIDQLASRLHAKAQRILDNVARSGGLTVSEIVEYIPESEDSVEGKKAAQDRNVQSISHRKDEKSISEIMSHFADPVGKAFAEASARCATSGCTAARRCAISAPMAKSLKENPSVDLVRLAVASQMNSCLWPTYLNP